ncbi:MAG: hypothetical protein H0U41_01630, partial [Actinobacteria bacterium]|nr:hypothetical protein [Actinomycetota bacterium]
EKLMEHVEEKGRYEQPAVAVNGVEGVREEREEKEVEEKEAKEQETERRLSEFKKAEDEAREKARSGGG